MNLIHSLRRKWTFQTTNLACISRFTALPQTFSRRRRVTSAYTHAATARAPCSTTTTMIKCALTLPPACTRASFRPCFQISDLVERERQKSLAKGVSSPSRISRVLCSILYTMMSSRFDQICADACLIVSFEQLPTPILQLGTLSLIDTMATTMAMSTAEQSRTSKLINQVSSILPFVLRLLLRRRDNLPSRNLRHHSRMSNRKHALGKLHHWTQSLHHFH